MTAPRDTPGDTPERLHAEGLALWRKGDLEQALEAIGRAVDLDPEAALIRTSFGVVLSGLGASEAAAQAWRTALALSPAEPLAAVNLGNAALAAADAARARHLYRRALAADPQAPDALGNLGALAQQSGEGRAALRLQAQALALAPDRARLWANLGSARHWQARFAEAGIAFDRALSLAPDLPSARFDRAINRLIQGDWRRGLADYEARRARPGAVAQGLLAPDWTGEDPKGRHLLLFAEQGQGDAIQFLRFVPDLIARGARVSLQVSPRLVSLFRDFPGLKGVHGFGEPMPAADLSAPLMSLPFLLGLGSSTPAPRAPYLAATPSAAIVADGRPLVGLLWAGNPGNETDARRSLALARLAPLFALERLRFVSLQFGERAGDVEALGLGHRIERPALGDFHETAAIVASLDLVVTVDTAMAHLAGAMAREAWVLLAHVPDWRWGSEGESTSWYPSLRLFRQKRPGDWESAIEGLADALAQRFPEAG
jgi:Flp pilus assembly protein TadD